MSIPADIKNISIGMDGTVTYWRAEGRPVTKAGQIQLTLFAEPSRLQPDPSGMCWANTTDQTPVVTTPGDGGAGALYSGWIEEHSSEPLTD